MAESSVTEISVIGTNVPEGRDKAVLFPFNFGPTEFSIDTATTDVFSFAETGATRLTKFAVLAGEETVTVTPTVVSAGEGVMSVILNEYSKTTATAPSYLVRTALVSGSDEIVLPELATKAVADVFVSIADSDSVNDTAGQSFKIVSGAPANANEVQLDEPNTKLVFFADSWRGYPMSIRIANSLTSLKSWFVEDSPQAVGNVCLYAVMTPITASYLFKFPSLQPAGTKTFSFGEEFNLDLEFEAVKPATNRYVFEMYDVTSLKNSGGF